MAEVGHADVLAAAVKAIGGTERPGQVHMADAVAECLESDHHLLIQAGTGTGKSLGYLAPVLLWLVRHPGKRMQSSRLPVIGHNTRSSKVVPTTCACFDYGTAPPKIKGR